MLIGSIFEMAVAFTVTNMTVDITLTYKLVYTGTFY